MVKVQFQLQVFRLLKVLLVPLVVVDFLNMMEKELVKEMLEIQVQEIHLVFLPHDLEDCRTIPRKEIRKAINDYMSIVLNEEPLDATLVDFDDAEAW